MRLAGKERDAVAAGYDLLTFVCICGAIVTEQEPVRPC
jgi:hypothetical protein